MAQQCRRACRSSAAGTPLDVVNDDRTLPGWRGLQRWCEACVHMACIFIQQAAVISETIARWRAHAAVCGE